MYYYYDYLNAYITPNSDFTLSVLHPIYNIFVM